MKILLVSQYFWPENFKGNDIATGFVKMGHEVTVLTAKPNYPEGKFYKGYTFWNKREEFYEGVRIIRTPILPRRNGQGLYLIINYISFIFFSFFTLHFRIKGKFDYIFVQQLSPVTMAIPGIWAKKKFKAPLFLWVLDLWPESVLAASSVSNPIVIRFLDKLVLWIYEKSDVILISSRSFKNSVGNKIETAKNKIHYFPNWAEDIFIKPKDINFEQPVLPQGFKIMFAGNVGEAQDFDTLLELFKIARDYDINWIIVGEGRKSAWLKEQIKNHNLTRVFVIGRYPIDCMPYMFKQADAMLVSLKDIPIFGLTVPAKIQAYQASGKIILGCLNGEGKMLINESKGGFAVNAGDYQGLFNCAMKIKDTSNEDRKKMEANSKNYYNQNFSKNKLFNQLENLFINFNKNI